jgi:hypothetical protein
VQGERFAVEVLMILLGLENSFHIVFLPFGGFESPKVREKIVKIQQISI